MKARAWAMNIRLLEEAASLPVPHARRDRTSLWKSGV
jgi:hypothetical protein